MRTFYKIRLQQSFALLTGMVFVTFLAGCGGGGGGSSSPAQVSSPQAVLIGVNNPSGLALGAAQCPGDYGTVTQAGGSIIVYNYSPVGIHITYTPPNSSYHLVEYHVYRSDFTGVGAPVTMLPPGTIPNPLPIATQSAQTPLDLWNDGADRPVDFQTSLTPKGSLVIVTSNGNLVAGTGIKETLIGKRFSYGIESVYRDGNGYTVTAKSSTNTVTYLQPVFYTALDFAYNSTSTKFLLRPHATLMADDYVFEISDTPEFMNKVTYTPYDPTVIQNTVETQTNPSGGPQFDFFNPATGLDMTQVAAKFGSPLALYSRIGVRDSRNGTSATLNPYLYSMTVQIPTPLF